MLYQNYPITLAKSLRLTKDNSIVIDYGTTVQMNARSFINESKTSVNTGIFTPGSFRVNPYEHGRESGDKLGSGVIRTRQIVSPTYYYLYEIKGPFGLLAYSNVYLMTRPTVTGLDVEKKLTLQKAFAKVGSSLFAGGENLGEIKETLASLRNPLKSLRDFFLKNRGRNLMLWKTCITNRKNGGWLLKETGKTVSSTWLELRYGLRPIVMSIMDIIRLVNKQTVEFDKSRIRTERSVMNTVVSSNGNCSGGNSAVVLINGKYEVKHSCKVMSIVYFKQSVDLSLSRKLGLNLVNIPETAWELTRLSFVVDWFFSIGPWIESFRINPEFEILGSTTSFKISSTGFVTPVKASGSCIGSIVEAMEEGPPAIYNCEWFNRVVNTTQPPSLPQFRGITGLDIPKTLDGLALILQGILHALKK